MSPTVASSAARTDDSAGAVAAGEGDAATLKEPVVQRAEACPAALSACPCRQQLLPPALLIDALAAKLRPALRCCAAALHPAASCRATQSFKQLLHSLIDSSPRPPLPFLWQPHTWHDDAGYCWCDSTDGGRYWFDADAQEWQYHGPSPPPEPAPQDAHDISPVSAAAGQPGATTWNQGASQQQADAPSFEPSVEAPQPAEPAAAAGAELAPASDADESTVSPVDSPTTTAAPDSILPKEAPDNAAVPATAWQPARECAASPPAQPVQPAQPDHPLDLAQAALILGDGPTILSPVLEEGEEVLAAEPSPHVDAPLPPPVEPEPEGGEAAAAATAWSTAAPLEHQPWGAAELAEFPEFPSPVADADFPDFPSPSAAAAAAAPSQPAPVYEQRTAPPFAADAGTARNAEDEVSLGPEPLTGQQQQQQVIHGHQWVDWQEQEREVAEPQPQPLQLQLQQQQQPAAVPGAATHPTAVPQPASTGPFAGHDEYAGGAAAWPPDAWHQEGAAAEDDDWLAGSPPAAAAVHHPGRATWQAPNHAGQQPSTAAEAQYDPRAPEAQLEPAAAATAAVPFQPTPMGGDEDWLQPQQASPWQEQPPAQDAGRTPDTQSFEQQHFEAAADDDWLASPELKAWEQPAAAAHAIDEQAAPTEQEWLQQPQPQQEWLQTAELAAWHEPGAEAAADEQAVGGWQRTEAVSAWQPDVLSAHSEPHGQGQPPNGWVHQPGAAAWDATAGATQQATQPEQQAWQQGPQQWTAEAAPAWAAAEPAPPAAFRPFVPKQPAPGGHAAEASPHALGPHSAAPAPPQPLHPSFGGAELHAGQFTTFAHSHPPAAYTGGGGFSPHGRPAASFGKLLFGGRLLLVEPSGVPSANAGSPAVALRQTLLRGSGNERLGWRPCPLMS